MFATLRLLTTALVVLILGFPAASATASAAAPGADDLRIKVLSNRADLVSGGDALVEIIAPAAADVSGLSVQVGSRDVSSAFAVRRNGRLEGLLRGLDAGPNVVEARLADGRAARLTITNHRKGGPVFAGPQVEPWLCRTEESGLAQHVDRDCNAPTRYLYFYKSTDPAKSGFQPYDPDNPPNDVSTTTTDQGETVPYIVRDERGTIDRSVYDIAVLYDPDQPWKPWAAQGGWNHKLGYTFGGGCAPMHEQTANSDPVLDDLYLSRGFAVASSGLNVLGNNCNEVVSAEAVTMVKERLTEQYGEVRYTIGNGCSGGSIQQQVIASEYPGLLDGIQPGCSYPDSWTTGMEVVDCSLLLDYFDSSPLFPPGSQQRALVSGHQNGGPCESWTDVYGFDVTTGDPRIGCEGLILGPQLPTYQPPSYVYDPETNPDGTRCTKQDYESAVVGLRPEDGFAENGFDNVGVQYGLTALQSGEILPEQFVDLNEKIGGFDIDYRHQSQRTAADSQTVSTLYRAGRVSNGRQLANVPIIDLRGADNYEIHTDYHSYAMRARLEQANGTSANQVIFTADTPLVVPPAVTEEAFLLMDRWLSRIESDGSSRPLAEKVIADKPSGAVDSCYIGAKKVTDRPTCRAAFPYYGAPRIAAGGPLADNVLKCQLKPLDRGDYDVDFTDDQWKRLQGAFPAGTCDWNAAGVGQQPPEAPWVGFAHGPGGRPLGPAPASQPY